MKNLVSYEDIGRVAYEYYLADIERFNAKHQRAEARSAHPCEGERHIGDGHVEPYPCWQYALQPSSITSHLPDWCDNCQYVQPFYLAYVEAAQKARVAKNKLTHMFKQMLWNEGNS